MIRADPGAAVPAMEHAAPYDELIMDHIRNTRNFRALAAPTGQAHGLNPLCGDELTVYVRVESGVIVDAAFQCSCCGVSMASASILTDRVTGLRTAEAKVLLREFFAGLDAGALPHGAGSGPLALLATTRRYPARKRCALLPWAALEAALEGRVGPVLVR